METWQDEGDWFSAIRNGEGTGETARYSVSVIQHIEVTIEKHVYMNLDTCIPNQLQGKKTS